MGGVTSALKTGKASGPPARMRQPPASSATRRRRTVSSSSTNCANRAAYREVKGRGLLGNDAGIPVGSKTRLRAKASAFLHADDLPMRKVTKMTL